MAAYVIFLGNVLDETQYQKYKEVVEPNILAAGGRYLVRAGQTQLLEGALPASRTVILEFPSMASALEWYHSDEYVAIKKLRGESARVTLYVVDGLG